MNMERFRFSILASITVNFLCNEDRKCFVVVCFSRIAMAITISRKHVREGKRICLLVCNANLIGREL